MSKNDVSTDTAVRAPASTIAACAMLVEDDKNNDEAAKAHSPGREQRMAITLGKKAKVLARALEAGAVVKGPWSLPCCVVMDWGRTKAEHALGGRRKQLVK